MTPEPRDETASGLLRVFLAATTWGSIPVFVRMASVRPAVLVFWRVALESATLLLVLLARRRLGELVRLPRRSKAAIAAMGVLLAVNWLLYISALTLTDVAVAALLAYLGPVFVAVLAPAFTGDPFDRRISLPLMLALAGTAVIVNPQRVALGGPQLLGALLALASAVTYALLVVNAKRLLRGIPTVPYMLGESLTATVLLVPAVLLLPGPSGARDWFAVGMLGVVDTALTGLLFLSGLRRVRADQAAVLTYAEPLAAVLFAALLLGEPISLATAAGGAAVIAAGVWVARLSPAATAEEFPVAPADAAPRGRRGR